MCGEGVEDFQFLNFKREKNSLKVEILNIIL